MKKLIAVLISIVTMFSLSSAFAVDVCNHAMTFPEEMSYWTEPSDLMLGCMVLVTEYSSYCNYCGYEEIFHTREELDHQYLWDGDVGTCMRCGDQVLYVRSLSDNSRMR